MKKNNFEKIYAENFPKVYRLCLGYAKGREDWAQDWTQEIFIKVWQNLENFRNDALLSTWIYRITVNTCLQELRSKKKFTRISDHLIDQDSNPISKENQFIQMYSCIDQLSAENKTIILLELENLPQSEIATITGISHQAIRTRIHRIKEQLSKCVSNEKF